MGASLEALRERQEEIAQRLAEINAEFAGEALPDDERDEWQKLNEEEEENSRLINELETRQRRLAELAERSDRPGTREAGAQFHINVRKTNADIYDMAAHRSEAKNPEDEGRILRDNALRAVERAQFPSMDREAAQDNVERMLVKADDRFGSVSRRLLLTGNPVYMRAWSKYIMGQPRTNEEERVMSLTTNSGGYGVPFMLDPTIILSSDGGVNPFRNISRIEQINVDTWQGVTSAGVSASFDAELAEVSDDSMTLAQPSVSTEMARAFVPFSIEIGMDYPNFAGEVAKAIRDAKDVLEADKFAIGSGSGEPQGIITGATAVVTASTRGSITSSDVYSLEAALPPRFRQRATWVANRVALQKFRQFDTAGGAQLWIQNLQYGLGASAPVGGNVGYALLGWPAYEASGITSTLTTGTKVAVLGDFQSYLIADRIGLSTEFVPHIFNTGNNLPSGERGIFAYWRVGAGVLFTNAFRTYLL